MVETDSRPTHAHRLTPVAALQTIAPAAIGRLMLPGCGLGIEVQELPRCWQLQAAAAQPPAAELLYKLEGTGLEARCRVTLERDYRVAVVRVRLVNGDSAPLTLLRTDPLLIAFRPPASPFRAMLAAGDEPVRIHDYNYPPNQFRIRESTHLSARWHEVLEATNGRSSSRHFPILLATAGTDDDAAGFFVGMEWSGNYTVQLGYQRDTSDLIRQGALDAPTDGEAPAAVVLRCGPRVHDLPLAAGEALELPAVHLGFFEGGLTGGTNHLRRYIHQRIVPPYQGRPPLPPVFYTLWGGIQGATGYTAESLEPQVERAAELGIEFFVADADWYVGGFPPSGDYIPDDNRWTSGIEAFARHVRARGMGMGLWFMPEVAKAGSAVFQSHPEWFIELKHPDYLLDLRLPPAQEWVIDLLCGFASRLELRWIRWDLGLAPPAHPPGPAWDRDPTGKMQFAYLEGLYRVLDEVRVRCPNLCIEANAGGGNRLDLGWLRRAHCAWLCDMYPFGPQARWMQARANRFLPANLLNQNVEELNRPGVAHGLAGHEPDSHQYIDLAVLSRMLGGLGFNGRIAAWPAARVERTRRWIQVFKEIRHLLVKDFYQLSAQPASLDDWDVVQFADGDEGLVFAFRVEGRRGHGCFGLRAIDPGRRYDLHDRVSGTSRTLPGRELTEGLSIELPRHAAGLWSYRAIL